MENVQVALAGICPPVRLISCVAGVIVPVVPVESQSPRTGSGVRLSGLAMIRPLGSMSSKLTLVRSVAGFGLVIVNVRVVLPFTGMLAAPKAFAMVGGDWAAATFTSKPNTAIASRKRRTPNRFRSTADINLNALFTNLETSLFGNPRYSITGQKTVTHQARIPEQTICTAKHNTAEPLPVFTNQIRGGLTSTLLPLPRFVKLNS